MGDNSTNSEDAAIAHAHNVELSERELLCIGHIIAQWGALESEIFLQTLQTFEEPPQELPKEMDNMQFSGVLEKWKERVVNQCNGEKKKNLEKQYSLIRHYHDYRNALVHGMWNWDKTSPAKIETIRIRKKEVISIHFTAADLEDLSLAVARINFNIRYPRGAEDLEELINRGGYIGRLTTNMLLGHSVDANGEAEPHSQDQSRYAAVPCHRNRMCATANLQHVSINEVFGATGNWHPLRSRQFLERFSKP